MTPPLKFKTGAIVLYRYRNKYYPATYVSVYSEQKCCLEFSIKNGLTFPPNLNKVEQTLIENYGTARKLVNRTSVFPDKVHDGLDNWI